MDEGSSDPLPLYTQAPDTTYGFIGIGNMGYGMAKNVRQKIPASSKLVICELNKTQVNNFLSEVAGTIEIANSPKEVAQQCVRLIQL